MPIYVYRAADPRKACDACRDPFDVMQGLNDPRLATCPECGAEVEKQVALVHSAFPDGPSSLRNKGFARLEKRSDGMYENVSAQPGAQKVGSLESFSKSLSKGRKPIISD
jgi:putative FmdB family regulatory protein